MEDKIYVPVIPNQLLPHGIFTRSTSEIYKVLPPSYVCWFMIPLASSVYLPKVPVKLELFAPTECYRLGGPHYKMLSYSRQFN